MVDRLRQDWPQGFARVGVTALPLLQQWTNPSAWTCSTGEAYSLNCGDTANKVGIRYPNFECVGVTKNGWVVGSYAHQVRATTNSEYFEFRGKYVP